MALSSVISSSPDPVQLLLDQIIEPRDPSQPEQIRCQKLRAIMSENNGIHRSLINQFSARLKKTMLTAAARTGLCRLIELLIEMGANIDMACGQNHLTPLHYTQMYKHVDAMKLLLRHEANPNIPDLRGQTVLHSIVSGSFMLGINATSTYSSLEILQVFLAYARRLDLTITDKKQCTVFNLTGGNAYHVPLRQLIDTIKRINSTHLSEIQPGFHQFLMATHPRSTSVFQSLVAPLRQVIHSYLYMPLPTSNAEAVQLKQGIRPLKQSSDGPLLHPCHNQQAHRDAVSIRSSYSNTTCSRCHLVYYCSRSCQVQDWKQHRSFCSLQAIKQTDPNVENKVKEAVEKLTGIKL